MREVIGGRAARLDFMVALGTHPVHDGPADPGSLRDNPSNPGGAARPVGLLLPPLGPAGDFSTDRRAHRGRGGERFPAVFSGSGCRSTSTKRSIEYDLIIILGPVFPHEVVGFSGGAKYLFPGVSGGAFLHFFHWLGALITCREIIGKKDTAVRRVIDRAMESIATPVHCLAMVVDGETGLRGLFTGDVREAWSAAADLSATLHIVTRKKPYRIVLGRTPEMYDEIWTAGKVMYKLEQVVTDGGKLIIYAPHVRRISGAWGSEIEKIGYHVRDYFLARPERFTGIPRGVLAHSTHVRGGGSYENGIEKPLVDVILATAIPAETCRRINLGYMDPASIRLADYMDKEEEGILYVDHAGETLYRLEGGG